MKNLLRMSAVAVLTCVFAASVCAGDMSAPGVAPTPTPQVTNATPPATDDEAGGVEFVLNVVLNVLGVL